MFEHIDFEASGWAWTTLGILPAVSGFLFLSYSSFSTFKLYNIFLKNYLQIIDFKL